MAIYNVILSGGVGSRLWPLSRKSRPKQYLQLFGGETLFQKTAIRNSKFCDEVLIVGNRDNYLLSKSDLSKSGIPDYKEIIEACPRNTAAAIAFAAFALNEEDILFVTPSDHLIESENEYHISVNRALELASHGFIVTFGLKPSKPETGYGYIEFSGEEVLSFREKPNTETAKSFVEQGGFLWNSGMFCFKAGVYLEELNKFEPDVYEKSKYAYEASQDGRLGFEESILIPSISVDYAVMEKTDKIKVIASHFDWSDMGSFESIYDYFEKEGHPKDENGNMVIGTDIYTEFTGLSDTILIYTKDALLVLNKENAQDVKKVYEKLEKVRPELI
jgi:mannose-1-phosphate guanylyltransferase